MKKIVIAILAVLAVLAGALLGLPSLVDWNGYRAQIAERVAAATGRAVELKGDVGLSILPTPAFTVRDARLANAPGAAEADMVRLKKLDVRIALGPLLGGRVQVESIALVEPTVVVEVLPDGRLNWDLSADRADSRGTGRQADAIVSSVSFDQVSIDSGTILYRDDRSGRIERLENVNARIVAGSLTGPFQVQGTFTLRSTPVRTEITTGRFTEGAAVPLRVSLGLQDSDATLRFAGIIAQGNNGQAGAPAASGGGPRAQGDLRAEGGDLNRVLAVIGAGGSPALAQPFNLRTAMEATTAAASFSNLEVQLGDTRASGSASLRNGTPTRAELTLALNRLDIDAWRGRFSTGAPAAADAQPSVPPPAPPAADGTPASAEPTRADRPSIRVPELPGGSTSSSTCRPTASPTTAASSARAGSRPPCRAAV
ncbi:AsmA family protein [Azospirillum thermophilum]|uniref:AsmA family protein n=1 Tax=Azospirillum thermophilum TaxID=2202148 RepID=UPI001FE98C03|nr:AsmA family protein [Azospirillum thermophilum]